MGRFTDPANDRLVKEHREKENSEKLALACLWKPKSLKIDSTGSYFFDEEHCKKAIEERRKVKSGTV